MTVPYASHGEQETATIPVLSTSGRGFIGGAPRGDFVLTVHPTILREFAKICLTPIYGRDILLNFNIVKQLERFGELASRSFQLMLPNGKPMILFEKADEEEIQIDGEDGKHTIQVYNPCLIYDALCRLEQGLYAERSLSLRTEDDIKILPLGTDMLHAPDLEFSGKTIEVSSELRYNDKLGPVIISSSNSMILHGDRGVTTQAVTLSAPSISMTSGGKIVDKPIMTTSSHFRDSETYTQTHAHISTFSAPRSLFVSAPKIEHTGTSIDAGSFTVEGGSYTYQPAMEKTTGKKQEGKTSGEFSILEPKESHIRTNLFTINSRDASITVSEITSKSIVDNSENLSIFTS
jgi:hypothetical protein